MQNDPETLLKNTNPNSQSHVAQNSSLNEEQRRKLLVDWNQTKADYSLEPLYKLFEKQAKETPFSLALIYKDQQLTYQQVNAYANKLAHYLEELGAEQGKVIALMLERSEKMILVVLAILKTGAAYLPLSSDYPKKQLDLLIKNSEAKIILTEESLVTSLETIDIQKVCIDKDWPIISEQSSENLDKNININSLAYILYTSGTTGVPKGVMITHSNLSNYTQAIAKGININPSDRYLHTAVLTFAASVKQFVVPLSCGACVVIAGMEEIVDPIACFQLIKYQEVTIVERVGSYWSNATETLLTLPKETLKELLDNNTRLLMSTGEPLKREVPKIWKETFNHPAKFINMYGQTESIGTVAIYPVETDSSEESKIVPIGRPLSNTTFYILDSSLNPVSIGTVGELHIGGLNLSKGYLNDDKLTKEKFIPNPFEDKSYIYKTGDLAKYREDGVIEFCGREDYQIKIHGIRIELAEIEFSIKQHPEVKNAIVIAKDSSQKGERYLVAYYVTNENTSISSSEFQNFLREKLPNYMVPSLFLKIDSFPLTQSGKVNLQALLSIEENQEIKTNFHAPITKTEKIIAKICCQLLAIDKIGREDNFFELGVHSLLVTQITIRLQEAFNIDLPFRSLFESPNIAELAIDIEAMLVDKPDVEILKIMANDFQSQPLAPSQIQVWVSSQLQPNNPSNRIHQNFLLTGELSVHILEQSINEVVSRHSALRLVFLTVKGKLIQQLNSNVKIPLTLIDISHLSETESLETIPKLISEEVNIKFNLTKGPLIRTKLIKLGNIKYIFLLTIHHLVCDGWSFSIFLDELSIIYQAFLKNKPHLLPKPKFQYLDFVAWQHSLSTSNVVKSQLSYWKEKLGNISSIPKLPFDYPRQEKNKSKGAEKMVVIEEPTFSALTKLSKQAEVTLFVTLVAAFKTLLYSYSRQEDLLITTSVSGRSRVEFENTIGYFLNSLPLRTIFSSQDTFLNMLKLVKAPILEAYTNSDIPGQKLIEEFAPKDPQVMSKLVLFLYQSIPPQTFTIENLQIERFRTVESDSMLVDLLVIIYKSDALKVRIQYNSELFSEDTINKMLTRYINILQTITISPEKPLAELTTW